MAGGLRDMSLNGTIVGCVVGLPEVDLIPWARTARHASPTSRIVLLAEEPEKYTGLANRYGIQLRTAWLHRDKKLPVANEVYKWRWSDLRDFLVRENAAERIVFADVRDTVFQRDPFAGSWPMDLMVGSEGITFGEEPWNRGLMQSHFARDLWLPMSAEVLNAGNVSGFAGPLLGFAGEMTRLLDGRDGIADMAAFNIALRSKNWLSFFRAMPDPWVLHCAQRLPDSTIKKGPCSLPAPDLVYRDPGEWPLVCDQLGNPFTMIHQWTYSRRALRFLAEVS